MNHLASLTAYLVLFRTTVIKIRSGHLLCPLTKFQTFLHRGLTYTLLGSHGSLPWDLLATSHPQDLLSTFNTLYDYLFIYVLLFQVNCNFLQTRDFASYKVLLWIAILVLCTQWVANRCLRAMISQQTDTQKNRGDSCYKEGAGNVIQ